MTVGNHPRRWRRRRAPQPEDGFVLLLAFFGALVLLLSSLSLQTLALQGRGSEAILRLRRQREDALFSAAQLVAGRLQQHRCLLKLPLEEWDTTAADVCSGSADREALLAGVLPGGDETSGRYGLVDYELVYGSGMPALEAGELTLEWRGPAGVTSQRRFRLALQVASDVLEPPLLRGLEP